MNDSPPSSCATELAERADVLGQLWAEFDRLNQAFFDSTLILDAIKLSTRKQYGGYYHRGKNQIVLSWLAHTEHGWPETLNTFRHEIAHMVHFDHSPAFWALAERLGCTRRHALPARSRPHAYSRYVYECPVCRTRVFRRKRIVGRASCVRCDKTAFNPRFVLRLMPPSK